ncbi:unnamed protein product [Rotaria sp. Silwood1]|nr:unnamed protein product [Rotaria sp. Silwood1]CAF1498416.1 unnamed protein product [Rotaria sp. Silwood1]CAF3660521.1 unnamed protein product [Rotaria sp. Silwood1]CAF3695951.1 unnamed protein product [Rotaria sp. Silwood1]CAF4728392.1 unnamed protein product [Rotaria sp. Silwood1]
MLITILLLGYCFISTSKTQKISQCNFEKPCEDFLFDSYWIVENVSSHIDHTYGNLSGHYITYTNSSISQPLTVFRTKDWINTPLNLIACDDLQARLPIGIIGIGVNDPEWDGITIEMFYATLFIPFVSFTNITGSLDIDDLSVSLCPSSKPIPSIKMIFDCDFDKTVCSELVSFSHYSYSWSVVQAEEAENYTIQAPEVDYFVGNKTGHYMWLNNSDSFQPGGAGYLSTYFFRFTSSDPIYCLSFQYYRFGLIFQTSKLTVLALNERDQKSVAQIRPINPINYTYINQRWSWAYAPLPIGNYSLLFRMDSDYEVNSSFAIDSISIKSCGYPQKYFYNLHPQSVINYTIQSPYNINDQDLGPKQATGWSGD